MKRVVFFLFAALMVAGLAVLAADVKCEKHFLFSIEAKTIMLSTGTLDFPSDAVTKPDATGWFQSNPWMVRLDTNTKVKVTVEASRFKLSESPGNKLPTQIAGDGNFAFSWTTVPLTGLTKVLGIFSAGVYKGQIWLKVYRSGISDLAGKYVATVKVTATAI